MGFEVDFEQCINLKTSNKSATCAGLSLHYHLIGFILLVIKGTNN
jgi:hypothetical protein